MNAKGFENVNGGVEDPEKVKDTIGRKEDEEEERTSVVEEGVLSDHKTEIFFGSLAANVSCVTRDLACRNFPRSKLHVCVFSGVVGK